MKTLCFFHSADLDGHCSGAIVKHFRPEAELHGINYDDEFPWELIDQETTVYMVDFCLQPFSDMDKLDRMCKLYWIDHHKSSEEHALEWCFLAGGGQSLEVGKAACELAWEWFSGRPTPSAVYWLGRYDVWDHEGKPNVLPFQYGIRMQETYPTRPEAMRFWKILFGEKGYTVLERTLTSIRSAGRTVMRYERHSNEKYAKVSCFETELDGLRLIACNKMLTNSMLFTTVWDPDQYDAMCTFGYRKGQWTVSLYTDKDGVDVSVVAKARGGGGHKGASGFQCKELPEGFLK